MHYFFVLTWIDSNSWCRKSLPTEKLAEVSIWSEKYPDKSNTICVQIDLPRTLSYFNFLGYLQNQEPAYYLTSIKHIKREKKLGIDQH